MVIAPLPLAVVDASSSGRGWIPVAGGRIQPQKAAPINVHGGSRRKAVAASTRSGGCAWPPPMAAARGFLPKQRPLEPDLGGAWRGRGHIRRRRAASSPAVASSTRSAAGPHRNGDGGAARPEPGRRRSRHGLCLRAFLFSFLIYFCSGHFGRLG